MTRLFLGSSELLTSFRLLLECLAFGLLLCFLLLLLSCSISLSEDDSEEEEELEEESESSECIGFFLFFSRTSFVDFVASTPQSMTRTSA